MSWQAPLNVKMRRKLTTYLQEMSFCVKLKQKSDSESPLIIVQRESFVFSTPFTTLFALQRFKRDLAALKAKAEQICKYANFLSSYTATAL